MWKVSASELTEDDVERMAAEGDLEGLVKALGYEGDWKIRWRAVWPLGKMGDPRAVKPPHTGAEARDGSGSGGSGLGSGGA